MPEAYTVVVEAVVLVSTLEAGTVYIEAADKSTQEGMISIVADMVACTVVVPPDCIKHHFGLVKPAAD